MMIIEKVSKIEFLKDHEVIELKPQFPNEPVISMDVPSASVGPRSTRYGAAASSPSMSSSSSSGVLRVLKSMFAWCRDTRQCQDVLLSNQRRHNEKMDIDEFPLPVPPLDDDPFATLSATDIATMEATPDVDETSGSKYEDDEEGDGEDDNE
jgi:hypothetical protein